MTLKSHWLYRGIALLVFLPVDMWYISLMIQKLAEPFRRLWYGKQTLAKAFWLYFVAALLIGPLILAIGGGIIGLLFYAIGLPEISRPVLGLLLAGWFVYVLIAAVGVWRSANARRQQAWQSGAKYPLTPAVAKFAVLLVAALYLTTAVRRFETLMQLLAS